MRILLYGRLVGGMKTHVNELGRLLSKKHKVTILSQDDLSTLRLTSGSYYWDKPSSLKKLKKEIGKNDIIHLHQPATSSEIPLVWSKFDARMINTFHISMGYGFYGWLAKVVTTLNARWFRKKSSCYIAIGRSLYNILNKYNKTVKIHNGIDTNKFKPKNSGRFFKGLTIGYLGRFDFYKNVEELIKVCNELEINLVISGKGVLEEKFKKMESDRLKILGFQSDPASFYNKIDIFASPSFIEGNICRTALEAMSCAKPVILSSCGGEECDIKQNFGLITKPDHDSLKATIKKILKKDLVKMGKEGRKAAVKDFDINVMVDKTEKVYKQALKEN